MHHHPLLSKSRSRDIRHANLSPGISVPPRPLEINPDHPHSQSSPVAMQPNPNPGFDAYERALWNWVNLYNLDAFL